MKLHKWKDAKAQAKVKRALAHVLPKMKHFQPDAAFKTWFKKEYAGELPMPEDKLKALYDRQRAAEEKLEAINAQVRRQLILQLSWASCLDAWDAAQKEKP